MSNQAELICGKIVDLETDRCAGWQAFYKADYELDNAVNEIVRLKKIIKELKKKLRSEK